MRAGPRMQVAFPNALSNGANNCDWIHGRGEVSSQCHISATKGSTIVCRLMNDGQMFFSTGRFCSNIVLLSSVEYMDQLAGWGRGPWPNS